MEKLLTATVVVLFVCIAGLTSSVFVTARWQDEPANSALDVSDEKIVLPATPRTAGKQPLASVDTAAFWSDADTPAVQQTSFEQEEVPRNRHSVEEIILQYFPDMDGDSLTGWIDTYQSVPVDELHRLLQQRQQLSSLFPVEGGTLRQTPTSAANTGERASEMESEAADLEQNSAISQEDED